MKIAKKIRLGLLALSGACYLDSGVRTGLGTEGSGEVEGEFAGPASSRTEGSASSTGTRDPGSDSTGRHTSAPANACEVERQWVLDLLEAKCAACHGPSGNASGGFSTVLDIEGMLSDGRIVALDPASSPLWLRIENGSMPPVGAPVPPEASARLGAFIEVCAAPLHGDCTNERVGQDVQIAAMLDDIASIDFDDRPSIRYLTFTDLHNASECDARIEVYRQATAHLINALSDQEVVRAPVAIDDARTILRIDLEDYGWDAPVELQGETFPDKWEALVDFSPYAFERLEDDAETLKTLAGTHIPFLSGRAFLDAASQPPLYHALAGVPETRQQLEALLGVDIEANVSALDVVRAGIQDSGVSRQNRIVERHPIPGAPNRAFWFSYDFADDAQESQNIFANPLTFDQAGGEIIFSLPNGLHAYMLLDADGTRIDVGPDTIVTDPAQEDGNVRNGVSCFGCHRTIIPVEDDVRAHVEADLGFDAQAKDAVREIYVAREEMAEIQRRDTATYQAALQAAGVDLDVQVDAIADSFARFRRNLTLEQAAAEIGLPPAVFATQIGGLDPRLAPLGQGSIKRDTWTELFPDTVCRLHLGLADAPSCAGEGPEDEDPTTVGP